MMRLTERRTMGDEIVRKRRENSKMNASADAWRNFFLHAFDEAQANLLCEMLSRCVADWSKEWRGEIEDVGLAIQDVLFDQLDKAVKEAQTQRRAIDIMRAQMDVMIGRPVEGQVVDVPKFIEGKVVKSSNVVPDCLDRTSRGPREAISADGTPNQDDGPGRTHEWSGERNVPTSDEAGR
jgi:hypothetical protein